ncbi:MAG TPA: DUF3455 domain-containing protein [Burkholderiales bacterium]|nr:DUF3455 domain-containing protein [Burkholderiales bacterium]
MAVPPGHERVMTLTASGTINYECRARTGMAGAYVWTVSAPDASLRHWSGWRVGRLYAGPTWAYRDGSRLRGTLLGAISAGADRLPDQLWKAQPLDRAGEFALVTHIRRTNATSGPPPATACDASRVGREAKAQYAADYSFFAPTRPTRP